ncbi:MAG: cell shape determination protein CcmA [Treponema sp. CETP13]|nr:MAG: cell shape determination protein CcmA [Treponema sp. CETP13]
MSLRDEVSINSLIGPGTSVLGNLQTSGFTRVDGDIDGNLVIDGKLIIGEKARIRGNISAKSAIIGGVVVGDIVAPDGIQLFSSASVIGDMVARNIRIDSQVLFQGACIIISDKEEFEKAKLEWNDKCVLLNKAEFVSQENE